MTIEQRLDQLERQSQRIERKNRRLTAALTMMAVAICAVVTVAATGENNGEFEVITTKFLFADVAKFGTAAATKVLVGNDAGKIVVSLGSNDNGSGLVVTKSATGDELVVLNSSVSDEGTVNTYAPGRTNRVSMGATDDGSGGMMVVCNKTGEQIVQLRADEYGNGVVGAWNRKGTGRTLQPGP